MSDFLLKRSWFAPFQGIWKSWTLSPLQTTWSMVLKLKSTLVMMVQVDMYKCKAVTLEFGPETSSMVSRLLAMFDLNLCSALDCTYSLLPSLIFQGVSESGSWQMLLMELSWLDWQAKLQRPCDPGLQCLEKNPKHCWGWSGNSLTGKPDWTRWLTSLQRWQAFASPDQGVELVDWWQTDQNVYQTSWCFLSSLSSHSFGNEKSSFHSVWISYSLGHQ